jgi:hypothetical protein
MRPRDRDATHHSLDEVPWVVGKVLSRGWPDQDVQTRHMWDEGLEREWSIPVRDCAVRFGVLTDLPLHAVSFVWSLGPSPPPDDFLTWKVTNMTIQQASLSAWLTWENLSTKRAAHRETVQKSASISPLGEGG